MPLPRSIRKLLLGFAVVLVVCLAAYLKFHHARPVLEVAYAGNKQVILWDSSAEIREVSATLKYGDRLDVLGHFQQQAQVRTAGGLVGWVAQSDLLSTDLWQKMRDLDGLAASSPVEARGATRVISNLHVGPGRDSPRLRQLPKGVPLELFQRQPVEVPVAAAAPVAAHADDSEVPAPPAARKEDWWLVRAHLADDTSVAGWVLARFIDLDVPAPLPDYASSAGMRVTAWFELDRVADSQGAPKPQYLLVGVKGGEGQPCDFTQLRVFTWGHQHERYETAFVASDLCGKLPVKLSHSVGATADPAFSFQDSSAGAAEERIYQMHQTVVRRVRRPADSAEKGRRKRG